MRGDPGEADEPGAGEKPADGDVFVRAKGVVAGTLDRGAGDFGKAPEAADVVLPPGQQPLAQAAILVIPMD